MKSQLVISCSYFWVGIIFNLSDDILGLFVVLPLLQLHVSLMALNFARIFSDGYSCSVMVGRVSSRCMSQFCDVITRYWRKYILAFLFTFITILACFAQYWWVSNTTPMSLVFLVLLVSIMLLFSCLFVVYVQHRCMPLFQW